MSHKTDRRSPSTDRAGSLSSDATQARPTAPRRHARRTSITAAATALALAATGSAFAIAPAQPAPAGDALVVAPEAAKAGAKVVMRMSDWYPDFPYKWVSWSDWLGAVDSQVKAVQTSGAKNIAAYALWNEPDWTWNTAKAGSFN